MTGSIRWTALKLTIFTMVTIVVTMWLASLIGNFGVFSGPYEVRAEFADASGLLRGDVVKAAGVTVGRVEGTAVEDGVAVVTMSLDEDVELPQNLGAEIRFRNLVGQKMIALHADGPAVGRLGPKDVIPLDRTESAFDLGALFNGLRPVIRSTDPRDINLVANALTEALRGREDEVRSFLSNVADISETVADKDVQIDAVLGNLNVVTEDLNVRDAQLQRTLADFETFLTEVSQGRNDLVAALSTLDRSARIFRRIVNENRGNITGELEDLRTILAAVDEKRDDLRAALRALPEFLVAAQRATSYGQWSMLHVAHVCKEDLGTCGTKALP